jgi:hypothetical protein
LNDGGDDPFDELRAELSRRERNNQLDDELQESDCICRVELAAVMPAARLTAALLSTFR